MNARYMVFAALAMAGLLVVAFLVGRGTAPVREVTKVERIQDVRSHVDDSKRTGTLDASTGVQVVSRVVTRTVPGPGCTGPATERIEEKTETRQEDRKETIVDQRSSESKRELTKVQETRITTWKEPRLILGYGATLDRHARFSHGPDLAVRLVGPIWAGGFYDVPSKNAGATLRLQVTW